MTNNKKIVLSMIVKDEEHIIEECLRSIYKYIDYFVICDTGSSDKTPDIIKNFFKRKNITGEIHFTSWVNFGHNRTEALNLCEGKGDYIWVIDADDLIVGEPNLSDLSNDSYMLKIQHGSTYQNRTQILKNDPYLKWHYVGVIHEYPHSLTAKTSAVIEGNYYLQTRCMGNRSQDPDKYKKDAEVLEAALTSDPHNERYVFYLAQSYSDAGIHEKSIKMYEKRIAMGGWFEEVYFSYYKIAQIKQEMNSSSIAIEEAYLKAHEYLPTRAEPLYQLALYFRLKDDFEKGYFYAKKGVQIKFPEDQKLFLMKPVYDYMIYDELSISAYYTGRYYEAYYYADKILKDDKILDQINKDRIINNRDFADKRILSITNC